MPTQEYRELCRLVREASTLGSVSSLLGWDQETYLPPKGVAARAEQQGLLAGITHERKTHPRVGELLAACEGEVGRVIEPGSPEAANIREMRRDYDLATKLPKDLVEEWATTTSKASEEWKHAREKSDFKRFAPWLGKVMDLARRKAACYGVPAGGEAYDALLNEYEPGITAREIERVFTPLKARLSDLIARVRASKAKVGTKVLSAKAPPDAQQGLGEFVLGAMGFDLQAGRLDTTTHPFCSGIAPGDTRLTTRYKGEKFTDALYGTMHEMGHGLYEQGLPKDGPHAGTPLAEAVSLGIHESQSRMWENFVGRGRPFWKWALPHVKKRLGPHAAALRKASVDDLFRAANTCTPSFIRVEADEGTYNLHVMIRFGIERGLMSGGLSVKDVPGAWNEAYRSSLGLKVPDDRRGCLQDVHWSFGLIGYFPTYTLGNLYAAQFWEAINKKIKDLPARLSKGDFAPLKKWLVTNIHAHGRRYRAAELCEKVTGRPLSADPLMRHLESRLGEVYGL
ncbi:MAG: carboxypeptidase M32 [Phycisphaeraceae bacterium]|nr:MAG: carboxypeptidase M32 [Phycisphaeraceae bacterium]